MSIQQLVREQCYSFFFLILLTGCFSFQGRSQEENNEAVKKRQRAIFVYNFAQQVQWKNIEDNQFFKIGVLGMDATIYDLQSLAQKRKIQGKPVEVSRFLKADNLRGIQLLYVNNKFKYDINYILKKISGKGILLVTEDYNFNSSMINMVNVGNSFEYEINERHIEKEGLFMLLR
ncbi:YfiR family protein [Aquimarina hainanensis]|uniref:YfiR family protein n=1 Tax=Aquimarina hainanensis TaxID=1578017 RepID=UPI00361B494A